MFIYEHYYQEGRPYHPQSQGQIEVLNKRVKTTLAHFLQRYTIKAFSVMSGP